MNITYERIPVKELKIERYNRTIRINDAKKIAAYFDESLLGLVVVSYRDGNYSIIDGQHRVMACRLIGRFDVMCQVFRDLTYEEEARLFVELNVSKNRRSLAAYDLVKGLYESDDQDVKSMFDVIESFGFTVSDQKGDNRIVCLSTVHRIIKKHGVEILAHVLLILKQAWGGSQESLKGYIIDGLAHLLVVYNGSIDRGRVADKFKTVLPEKILAEADADPNGGQKKTRVARQMLKYYNKNLTPSKKLRDRF